MKRVVFISDGQVNGKKYKKGDELNVSRSIFEDLTQKQKCAKEKEKKGK